MTSTAVRVLCRSYPNLFRTYNVVSVKILLVEYFTWKAQDLSHYDVFIGGLSHKKILIY